MKISSSREFIIFCMKITVFQLAVMLSFTSLSLANDSKAQGVLETRITLETGQTSLKSVLKQLESQGDIKFVYSSRIVPVRKQVSVSSAGEELQHILSNLLQPYGIDYEVINEQIVLVKAPFEASASLAATMGNSSLIIDRVQQTITGKVTDAETGESIPGVNVLIKGTTVGTSTDMEGNYSLSVPDPDGSPVLVFSFLGYASQEVPVGTNPVINVSLAQDVAALDEVVVVGYGTQSRREVTSAIATVKAEDFNQGGSRSPLDLIQGKVAGLSITRNQGNNPNSSAAIQLRGITSIEGDRSPLIVIDGIPGGDLDLLQQDDIASFDVLKDGSAAAIYGTRANGGVILITTKKGRAGEPRFNYSTYVQREVVDKKPDYLNASEYRELIDQGLINESEDLGASTDLYDMLINKDNLSQYHNFAASGGSAKTNYRASVYFNEANGIAKQNGRKEFGGRLNINQTGLQDRLHLQVNLATNFNKANMLGGGDGDDDFDDGSFGSDFEQAIQRNPTAPIRNPDGSFVETTAYNNYNPLSRLENRIAERNEQTFSGDAKLTLDIIDGLTASAFGSYVRNSWNDRYYRSVNDWDQREGQQYQGMGYASKRNHLDWTQTFESTVNYQKTFAEDHSLDAIVGYSYQYATTELFNVNNNGFTTDAFEDWNLGEGSAISNTDLPRPGMGSEKYDNTLVAFFGRVNYSFRDKYFAQVILRREGSSRFGVNNKWGNFPAASVGWTLSQEDFIKDISFINNLKLRVGYGETGNQGIPNYRSLITLSGGGVYPQNGVYYETYGPSRNPNPDLRWETKKEWNFGLDFGLFENRLSGALDVYSRTTEDLLYSYTTQLPSFIHADIFTNVGSISNKGVELLLSVVAVDKPDFDWSMDFTANSQFNRLTSLSNDLYKATWLEFAGLPSPGNLGNAIRVYEGGTVGNFYGKRFAGFTEDGQWQFYKADGSIAGADEMNEEDLTVIGNGVPKYMASWSNSFRYRNFDLTVFFRGKFGFDILNTKQMYFGNKKWLPNNLLQSAVTTHAELNDDPQYSDYYIEKGDFVKLDNVTLGYNFSMDNPWVRNLRVYVTARNLATFTGYSGIDPELQDIGFETGVDNRSFYPRTKSFTLGLNVGF